MQVLGWNGQILFIWAVGLREKIWLGFGQTLGWSGQLVGWAKSVGSEQVLGAGLPGEGWEGEDRQNSWINIAPLPLHIAPP